MPGLLGRRRPHPGVHSSRSAAFTPLSLFPTLWLPATGISGLADGDPVASWLDASGHSNNATQATAGNKPTYKTNIANGKPAVRFATDDFLTLGAVDLLSTRLGHAFTIISVIANTPTGDGYIIAQDDNTLGRGFAYGVSSPSSLAPALENGLGRITGNGAAYNNETAILAVTATCGNPDTAVASYKNGAHIADSSPGSTTNTDPAPTGPVNIGRRSYSGAEGYFNGDILELLTFSSALAAGDLSAVTAYLGATYGITVT